MNADAQCLTLLRRIISALNTRAVHYDPGSDSRPGFPQRWQSRQSLSRSAARLPICKVARPGSWPLRRFIWLGICSVF